mmetsp:Transcript_11781/g.18079  ORF Transcript_11781/g.18079 Transcript_11781/m.18079 type:complete len:86 (+) Transcript_11781:721-978(+)
MWDGLGAERCPPPPPTPPRPATPPGSSVVVLVRCSGGSGSYRIAVKAHSEEGMLLDARAGLSGSEAWEEYLEWRLKIASSIRAAS